MDAFTNVSRQSPSAILTYHDTHFADDSLTASCQVLSGEWEGDGKGDAPNIFFTVLKGFFFFGPSSCGMTGLCFSSPSKQNVQSRRAQFKRNHKTVPPKKLLLLQIGPPLKMYVEGRPSLMKKFSFSLLFTANIIPWTLRRRGRSYSEAVPSIASSHFLPILCFSS